MAIRIRTIENVVVALCAAKTISKVGNVYLDDNIHHALSTKFCIDLKEKGFLKEEKNKNVKTRQML
jgi:hypothetical protein